MAKVLLINGPNLNMLGVRDPAIYGTDTLATIEREVQALGAQRGIEVDCFQSNHEGALIDCLHNAHGVYDGIIYNPGAHTHYSYALHDAVETIDVPVVEVHLSDIAAREEFRRHSVIAPACIGQIKGMGKAGYALALDQLQDYWQEQGWEPRKVDAGESLTQATAEELGLTVAQAQEASVRRLDKLREVLASQEAEGCFLRHTTDIQWLTAFDDVFDDEEAHGLLVTPTEALLHTDSRYSEACQKAATGGPVTVDVTPQAHSTWVATCWADQKLPAQATLTIEDTLSLKEYHPLEAARRDGIFGSLQETDGLVLKLRAVKDATEIARLKAAQALTDAAFAHICIFIKPGMTEREVALELESFMLAQGASGLAFPSIVAAGAHGSSPHAIPGDQRLEAGQCVVLDFGARLAGYDSDMTRTVFLGTPSAAMVKAYEAIRAANEEVEALLRPGVTGAEAHARAEEILSAHGFAGKMGHGLGHGVGIDIHELPTLSPRNPLPLEVGNVVTVEPGVYLPGEFGMRLEDFGVITPDGFEVFTQSSHELVVL